MSVLDRVNRSNRKPLTDTVTGQTSLSNGGGQLALADPPVVQRLRMFFSSVIKFTDGTESGRRYAWILKTVMDELLDEMADEDNGQLEEWFAQCGQFIEWIGTGKAEDMPAAMREKFAIPAPVPELDDLPGLHDFHDHAPLKYGDEAVSGCEACERQWETAT